MQGKSIAIVAGSNPAIDNVYEKLEKEKISFIAAKLGKKCLQEKFFSSDNKLPDLSAWILEREELYQQRIQLRESSERITQLLETNNQLAVLKETYSRLTIEKQYFDKHFEIKPVNMSRFSFFNKWNAPNLLNFLADFKYHSQYEKLSWLAKFKWLYKYKIYKFKDFQLLNEAVFKGVISEYYQKKSNELMEQITSLEHFLANESFERLLEQQTQSSIKLFKNHLAVKYQKYNEIQFNRLSYKHQFNDFLTRFPIVLSTTNSIINNKNETDLFDYIIVDEASQVDLLTGFLSMSCAKNIVVVGDLQQLPHIPDNTIDRSIDQKFNIQSDYSYFSESLLSSLEGLFPHAPKTLLKEHYRCHPRIIDFCNQKFYNGQLVIMTSALDDPFKIIKTEQGNHARKPKSNSGFINVRELDVINNEVLESELKLSPIDELGFISPYRAQADEASSRLSFSGIASDTVHKFQGREKESIIFSTTANQLTTFMDQPDLLNVAVSRAKHRFTMITSQNVLKQQGSNIGDLLRHIEYQSLSPCLFESKTISIFDCLYKEYSPILTSFMSKVKRQSPYLSEDLMSTLLDEVIENSSYNSFYYHKNYTLSLLINDFSILSEQERKFANNSNSHIDFLLYNKLDMQPILAIEVDGYKFHELNEKQKIRDIHKNNILEKLSLPLLRLSTVESGEKEKIKSALNNIIEAPIFESE